MKKQYVSIPEVLKILSEKEELSESEKENLTYSEVFTKIHPDDVADIKSDLKKIVKLPEKVLTKLIDLRPATKEELTSIFSSYGVIIPEKDLNTLLDYFISLRF